MPERVDTPDVKGVGKVVGSVNRSFTQVRVLRQYMREGSPLRMSEMISFIDIAISERNSLSQNQHGSPRTGLYLRIVIHIIDPDLGVGRMGTVSVRVVNGDFRNRQRTDDQVLSVGLFSRTTEQTGDTPTFRLGTISVHIRQSLSFVWGQEVNNSNGIVPISSVIHGCQIEFGLAVEEGNDSGSLIIREEVPDVVLGGRGSRRGRTDVNLIGDNIPTMRMVIMTRLLNVGDLRRGDSKGSSQQIQKSDGPHNTKEVRGLRLVKEVGGKKG